MRLDQPSRHGQAEDWRKYTKQMFSDVWKRQSRVLNLERMKVEEMSLEALSTRWCRHSGLPGLSQSSRGRVHSKEKTPEICMEYPGDVAEC